MLVATVLLALDPVFSAVGSVTLGLDDDLLFFEAELVLVWWWLLALDCTTLALDPLNLLSITEFPSMLPCIFLM